MKNLMTIVFTLIVLTGSLNISMAASVNKDVVGSWKYEVPTAPYGYEKGTLTFTEKEGELVGEVKFADGYKIELKTISYENGVLKCGLYVDYELVSIKAKVEKNRITGMVNTSEGEMKITAEKQE